MGPVMRMRCHDLVRQGNKAHIGSGRPHDRSQRRTGSRERDRDLRQARQHRQAKQVQGVVAVIVEGLVAFREQRRDVGHGRQDQHRIVPEKRAEPLRNAARITWASATWASVTAFENEPVGHAGPRGGW